MKQAIIWLEASLPDGNDPVNIVICYIGHLSEGNVATVLLNDGAKLQVKASSVLECDNADAFLWVTANATGVRDIRSAYVPPVE